ncbi:YycH family regulatory protein [Paenibacillus dakarensis]|uniref:YycH family regulatory protein n=1 Tax=Paenibacillus dakarensis TaxID=1527293 RepID=UPI0006D52EDC|nr:two-component system activity regulator YycH [Paenibacillus dakarensis]
MKERIKTAILLVLVLGSLVQSYFLIYRLPGSESVARTENAYIKTETMGPDEKVENLIYPKKMIIHMGEDKHTVFYPDQMFYDLVYNRLKGREFEGFQRRTVNNMDWSKLRSSSKGIEMSFGSGMPVTLLQKVMQIKPDSLFEGENIDKLWVYSIDGEPKVHALFFSTEGGVVYEAAQVDLTVQDIHQLVDFGQDWVPYTMLEGTSLYIPEQPLNMVNVELAIDMYTVEQMQRSLFFDPSITRNIQERDGSEIYTDSKRSLQVDERQNWMSYTDPAAPPSGESSPGKDVLSAVDFVNQHGGWNGSYRVNQSEDNEGLTLVEFQQYHRGYPILNTADFHFGTMKVELQNGTVTSYERSLLYVKSEELKKKLVKLPAGEELQEKLGILAGNMRVVDVEPVYLPILKETGLWLKPAWGVQLSNGSMQVVD